MSISWNRFLLFCEFYFITGSNRSVSPSRHCNLLLSEVFAFFLSRRRRRLINRTPNSSSNDIRKSRFERDSPVFDPSVPRYPKHCCMSGHPNVSIWNMTQLNGRGGDICIRVVHTFNCLVNVIRRLYFDEWFWLTISWHTMLADNVTDYWAL